ncbi:MAG: hypothetical protein H0X37_26370 [Herpetosiphonaceae bacterium]|nr:hypothetical protein [Herpetosiphonaceae bacterium]
MSQATGQEPVRSLPKNHVIGVIEQLQEAEQAVQALQNAGHAAQDILLIPSQTFIEAIQQRRQQTSSFKRATHAFLVSSDDGFPAELYLEQAQRGAQVLAVYASTREQADQIVHALHAYHVHHLKYFSPWTTNDYP